MKKIGLCLLSLVLIFALVSTGGAQGVKLGNAPDSAKEIVISGEIDLTTVYLDSGLTSILDGENDDPTTLTIKEHQKSAFGTIPLITLNFEVDCGDKVSVLLQLENRRLDSDGEEDWGTDTVDSIGQDNIDLGVEQAYIKVTEFLIPELTFAFGIQDLKMTLRKGEGAFFMDVAESELAAMPGVSHPETAWWDWDGTAGNEPDALPRDTTEFGGLKLDYGNLEKDNYAVSFFYGIAEETGVLHEDEELKGFALEYKLPGENNILKAVLAQSTQREQGMNFYTLGAGAVYWAQPQLECYGEVYLQTGDWAKTSAFAPLVPDKDQGQSAQAFRFGARYNVEHELKPYADLSYWSLSGDKGKDGDGAVGGINASDNEDFISYENVQSTLILEGNLLGLDLDSNYTAIKVEAGITTSIDINKDGKGEPVDLKLLMGMFTLVEEPDVNTYGRGYDDALGTEIDLVATLKYTESLAFSLGLGFVTGADYFEGADTDGDGIKDAGFLMDETGMTLFMFDTRLKF